MANKIELFSLGQSWDDGGRRRVGGHRISSNKINFIPKSTEYLASNA